MTISNPSLELTFLGGDLEKGHSSVQTIINEGLVGRSISFTHQLLNGLKSSSNQATLQVNRRCPSIEDIIATDGDIKAVLKDSHTVLFTGYLSTNYSWSIAETGEKAMSITLEDVGTRLFGKPFIKSGHHLFNCAVSAAITAICTAAGVTVSSQCLTLSDVVTKTVDSSATCRDIMDQMLYELGHVYYFDNLGELRLYKVDCQSVAGIPDLDGNSLVVSNGKAIVLSKKIRQYRSARVSFRSLGTASGYLVYRNASGKDASHPYCNMELPAGSHFDGTEIFPAAEWTEATADELREPAIVSACNAESELDLVGSNAIIAVSSVRQEFTCPSADVISTITAAGGPYLKIEAENKGHLPYFITRLDAYGSIVYEKETCIVRTADIAIDPSQSDSIISEELVYVHDRILAQAHANLLGQYHRFCNSQYSFSSRTDIALGALVRLHDTVFTGLDVNVMVIAKESTDGNSVLQYSAIGISAFSLNSRAIIETMAHGRSDTIGKVGPIGVDGKSFTLRVDSSNGSAFRIGRVSTTLSCHVFLNLEEVTSSIDDWRFQWKRSSGNASSDSDWNASQKAIGHKTVDIDSSDCPGRTVFSCEVDFDGLEL